MRRLTVYCAHPISGLTPDEVFNYYKDIKDDLETMGFSVLQPMTGKGFFRTSKEERFKPIDAHVNPLSSNHGIFERDQWMVRNSDILYLDLTGYKNVSIGCMMELAWASLLGKYTVVVMETDNIHRHAFVAEAADIIFDTPQEALVYMDKLFNQEF